MTVAAEPIKHLQDTRELPPELQRALKQLSHRGFGADWPRHGCSLCALCRASRWCVKLLLSAGTTTPRPGSRRSALRSASASSSTTTSSREEAVQRRRSLKTAPWPPPSSAHPRAPKRREVAPRRVHLGKGRSLDRCLDLLPGGLRLSLLPLDSGSGQGDVFMGIKSRGVGVIPCIGCRHHVVGGAMYVSTSSGNEIWK